MVLHRFKKSRQLLLIQSALGANAAANIQSERSNPTNSLGDIFWLQPSGQKDRDIDCFTNAAADRPVVSAPGSAQLFARQLLVSRIEQDRVNASGDDRRFRDRFFALHV